MITLIGVNHKTAPAQWRGSVSIGVDDMSCMLKRCYKDFGACFILSTCNRTEFVLDGEYDVDLLCQWWAHQRDVDAQDIRDHIYFYTDEQAMIHLMRVASGLDAVVLGEKEIFGQLKKAYQMAAQEQTLSPLLRKSLDFVIRTVKRVRTVTNIDKKSVSIPYCTMKLLQQLYADFTDKHALLIGRGDIIALSLKYLQDKDIGTISLANRSKDKMKIIDAAQQYQHYGLDQLCDIVGDVDIIISATGSEKYLLDCSMLDSATESKKPLFIADLSIPLDVNPKVGNIKSVYLYNMDDLHNVASIGQQERLQATQKADSMLQNSILQWQLLVSKIDISEYAALIENKRCEVVQVAIERLNKGDNPADIIRHVSHDLTHQLIQEMILPLLDKKNK